MPVINHLAAIAGRVESLASKPDGYFDPTGSTNSTSIDATLNNGTPLANGGWIFSGNLAANTPTPGLLNGNYTSDPGVDVAHGPGEYANFAVVGWSANIGTTYADAKTWWNNGNPNSGPSGYFAISGIATNVLSGGGMFPVPTIFGPTPGYEIQGMTLNLYTIPEPSTFTLAGFGVVALLALRRRKQSNLR